MKQSLRVAPLFFALALPLTLAAPAQAAQSALVGRIKSDGTIQLYTNRFQTQFADGTPVVKIEAARVNGVVRVYRRAAQGCPVEAAVLDVGQYADNGWHDLWETTDHPVTVFDCQDDGCRDTFTEGVWTASCGDMGTIEPYILKCICIRTNNTDLIIGEEGYCKQKFQIFTDWVLVSWIKPQYIQ